jgi:predicted DCC family thiol-disulfide oxidoreductase YuxK
MTAEDGPVLLYDGVCGLCNTTVRLLLRADRRGVLRFAALESDFAADVLGRHPELEGVDSLVLVERRGQGDERVYVRSEALVRAVRHLGGFWRVLGAVAVLPRPLRDWAYDLVARHRYRIFGRFEAGAEPPEGSAERFLA